MAPDVTVFYIGLAVLTVGAVLSNLAVSKMAKVVKMPWRIGGKGDRAADGLSRAVIRQYRKTHEDGPLFRNLVIAYSMCGLGAAIVIASIVIRNKS